MVYVQSKHMRKRNFRTILDSRFCFCYRN